MAKRREDEEYYSLTNKNTNVVQPGGGRYEETEGQGAAPAMPDAWGGAYREAVQRYTQMAPFTYDYRSDPRWQAYKKEYTREGRRATEDTLGQYAAMTGGVPSTAAVTAAGQAGDYYNAKMTDRIPELYELAYAMYTGDADRLYRQVSALRDARGDELGRYQAELSQWNADRDRADRLDQQSWERGFREREYGDSRADRAADEDYRERTLAADRADRAADEDYRERTLAADRADRAYDEAYRERAYADARADKTGTAVRSGGGQKAAEGEKGETETEAPRVDYGSILDLGYGPLSADRLRDLIEAGEVEQVVEDGVLRYRRVKKAETKDLPGVAASFDARTRARLG